MGAAAPVLARPKAGRVLWMPSREADSVDAFRRATEMPDARLRARA
jgi:hypothetical protein